MANESRKKLWPDEDEWLDFFRWRLCGHPELAEHVARIWFALVEQLCEEPGRAKATSDSETGPRHQRRSPIRLPGHTGWRTGITCCRFRDM